MALKINEETGNILRACRIEGDTLYLPPVQLDRKLYTDVNKVLAALGGKWNRKEKGHIFTGMTEEEITTKMEQATETDTYVDPKKEMQFFETPEALAREMVELADIQPGETVLEPSAGRGRIADLLPSCDCIELNTDNRKVLEKNGHNVIDSDFTRHIEEYDVIVANPPFSKQQDIDHVNKMIDLARRRVVSVMSASVMFRDNKKTVEFRERVQGLGGSIMELPQDTFKESGTKVNTCLVIVDTEEVGRIPVELDEPDTVEVTETEPQLSLF